ncbi:hypothetical protein [Saccharopolyspora sp. NPDC002376]
MTAVESASTTRIRRRIWERLAGSTQQLGALARRGIANLDQLLRVMALQRHLDAYRTGVLVRVGQRLLHHPMGRVLHHHRQVRQ